MKNNDGKSAGFLFAIISVLVWGTTFISTKVLLGGFSSTELIFWRVLVCLAVLFVIRPRFFFTKDVKRELLFALAGVFGITAYHMLENAALEHTLASIVSVIISVSPLFTAILSRIFLKDQKLRANFFVGFALAIGGICLISFDAGEKLTFDAAGVLLTVGAAFSWAVYSLIIKKISSFGYDRVLSTRRVFEYGFIFMIPIILFKGGFSFKFELFLQPKYLFNVLYLGVIASALCFIFWNLAIKSLGPVTTSVYIYAIPVVTILASIPILHERLTFANIVGVGLAILGLVISELKVRKK